MALITSQKIATLYERFKSIDVTFTKEIIQVTGLITNQVFIKCVSDFWPCVIFSASFEGAKVVANAKSGILKKMEMANHMVSLRFSFRDIDSTNPVAFFVNCKVAGSAPYGGSADTLLFNLQFTQRPPDDLIEIMGRILEANINSAKRKEERVLITPDSIRRMNLVSKDCVVFIQGVPRRCILRDIAFTSAKVIMVGVEKFLVNKDVTLRMDFEEPRESIVLKGKFVRAEPVEGRKELMALALAMDENNIPMSYKLRISDFISQVRIDGRNSEEAEPAPDKKEAEPPAKKEPAPKPAAAAEAPKAAEPAPAPQAESPKAAGAKEAAGSDNFDLSIPG